MRKGFPITLTLLVLVLCGSLAFAQAIPHPRTAVDPDPLPQHLKNKSLSNTVPATVVPPAEPKLVVTPSQQNHSISGVNGEQFIVTPTAEELSEQAKQPPPEQLEGLYHQVWERIGTSFIDASKVQSWGRYEHSYDGRLKSISDLDNAITYMVNSLDEHGTRYISDARVKQLVDNQSQKLLDCGITPRKLSGGTFVVDAITFGSPAYNSVIREGDVIKTINDKSMRWNRPEMVEDMLSGKEGTKVTLVVIHSGKEATVELTFAPIVAAKVESKLFANRIAYVRLPDLESKNTLADFVSALVTMNVEAAGRIQGIILDLRNNEGGQIELAQSVAAVFMAQGDVLKQTTRVDRMVTTTVHSIIPVVPYKTAGLSKDMKELLAVSLRQPLVVLVNGSTGNAAEVLAGALQDNERAIVMGTATQGDGYGYLQGKLPNGGLLIVAVHQFVTPKGGTIVGKGIRPDKSVDKPADATTDVQLAAAVDELTTRMQTRQKQLNDAKDIAAQPAPQPIFTTTMIVATASGLTLFVVAVIGVVLIVRKKKAKPATKKR